MNVLWRVSVQRFIGIRFDVNDKEVDKFMRFMDEGGGGGCRCNSTFRKKYDKSLSFSRQGGQI
jgi:hypothetical protein